MLFRTIVGLAFHKDVRWGLGAKVIKDTTTYRCYKDKENRAVASPICIASGILLWSHVGEAV